MEDSEETRFRVRDTRSQRLFICVSEHALKQSGSCIMNALGAVDSYLPTWSSPCVEHNKIGGLSSKNICFGRR